MISRLSSIRLFFWLLGLILAACVVGAVVPQGESPEKYADLFGPWTAGAITRLGLDRLFSSAWFMFLLSGLGVNLAACSVRRIKTIRSRPGVFLTHVAVLVILTGALVRGLFGQHGVLPMRVGENAGYFISGDEPRPLPFQVRLDDFEIDYRSAGIHRIHFIDRANMKHETITFNGPGTHRIDPMDAEIRIAEVYPDFRMGNRGPESLSGRPNNPAVRIEIAKNGQTSKRWLFARFPDFDGGHKPSDASPDGENAAGHSAGHGAAIPDHDCCAVIDARYEYAPGVIGQFRSRLAILENGQVSSEKTIWVNEPFRHKGYTFYQSGYDPDDPHFSSLQVAKDPSVPIVYAGFAFLPIGLIWSFLQNPKSAIRNPIS